MHLSLSNIYSGLGLGKTAQGRLNPVEATTSRGLGQKGEKHKVGLKNTMSLDHLLKSVK